MYMQARNKVWRMTIVLLIAFLGQRATVHSVSAHGVDRLLRVEAVPLGNATLTVWTSPSRLRPGEVHIDVQIMRADGTLTTTPFVQVIISPRDAVRDAVGDVVGDVLGKPQKSVAHPLAPTATGRTVDPATATHEARFQIDDAGHYQVMVAATDAQGHVAEMSFPVTVTPVPLALTLTLHTLLVGSLAAGAWVIRMGRRVWQPQRHVG